MEWVCPFMTSNIQLKSIFPYLISSTSHLDLCTSMEHAHPSPYALLMEHAHPSSYAQRVFQMSLKHWGSKFESKFIYDQNLTPMWSLFFSMGRANNLMTTCYFLHHKFALNFMFLDFML
jgi:hypothetical protein